MFRVIRWNYVLLLYGYLMHVSVVNAAWNGCVFSELWNVMEVEGNVRGWIWSLQLTLFFWRDWGKLRTQRPCPSRFLRLFASRRLANLHSFVSILELKTHNQEWISFSDIYMYNLSVYFLFTLHTIKNIQTLTATINRILNSYRRAGCRYF